MAICVSNEKYIINVAISIIMPIYKNENESVMKYNVWRKQLSAVESNQPMWK